MSLDYRKLKGRIIEKYGSQTAFAKAIGLSERSLSLKLNNIRDWKQPEIIKAMELLTIPENALRDYFFTLEVQ